ncbi:cytidylate kinase [Thiothrix eikelboomii]|uniref:Cytidylate kinase n=1 Tax=Thiothrix eikelboomii TaxID=92487 RepID=A0A1T4W1I2_9GAMM|nr:(d)CMP kinase [Thiothrix eikelboomii]SKA71103.1 cytidylate kinase [Thiothrix eikelboomii]
MENKQAPVITIDGPAGSGKGTIAALLAKQLGWFLLDSGAIYRVAAHAALEAKLDLEDETALVNLIQSLAMRFTDGKVWRNHQEVSLAIRTPVVADATSRISTLPAVRAALIDQQRAFRQAPGLVADGRDMGTVVFPDAKLKVFLTASPEIRAQRRLKQLSEQGIYANIAALIREIKERDERDSNRPIAPLRPADDALIIDSSQLSPEEVLSLILQSY